MNERMNDILIMNNDVIHGVIRVTSYQLPLLSLLQRADERLDQLLLFGLLERQQISPTLQK